MLALQELIEIVNFYYLHQCAQLTLQCVSKVGRNLQYYMYMSSDIQIANIVKYT